MLRLNCEIIIQGTKRWTVRKVHSVRIEGDSSELSDTCKVELPKNIRWAESKDCPVRRGDSIEVWLGYEDKLERRFVGYVKNVRAGVPTVLTAEDSMFLLRKQRIKKKLYTNTTINKILEDIVPDSVRLKVSGEISVSSWRTTADTVAGEIEEMADSFPIKIFFEIDTDGKPTMFVFSAWIDGRENCGEFSDRKNIIEHDLEYHRSEDVRVRIKGVSKLPNGKKIEYEEGEGDHITKNYYDLTLEQLKKVVKEEIKMVKWDGLKGSFTTFGKPEIKKMSTVDLDIEGVSKARYIVKGVNVDFGMNGYRQDVELQRKVVDL